MKNWFITGISSGLGKCFAQTVIGKGDFVTGTFRNQPQTNTFNIQHKDKAFALTLDISKTNEIEKAVKLVIDKFGQIDVLVNNAGYGIADAIEETSIEETKAIFKANFFGTLNLTQSFLPIFRRQKSGHIINFYFIKLL
ncbi:MULTISPECIES: SDR family NAD(P)-dependent oxidoreductase [Flavobacterium]|uniref:SDR family NAD(P)-dependent oxidoreductase n=1 Tax=Flavobacterium TaxID=237 RepID=UPI002114CF89|nr:MULTISPECIES: SDR family NAD(P)-dependent oxidoreductase [Flavobacterium]UUF12427.1 SDR family NAD(P)-dependent oxidoreductase [Flavobacterium panici]